jgi:hypothetical protein
MSNDSGHYQGSYSERKECGVIGAYKKYSGWWIGSWGASGHVFSVDVMIADQNESAYFFMPSI